MAEINTASTPGSGRGKVHRKVHSTRVDMTPMVDLGFLLITFFMLATTLAQPKAMNLTMPRADGDSMKLGNSKALTIMLGGHNRVAWYEGMGNNPAQPPQVRYSSFAAQHGIGDVIRQKRRQVMEKYHSNELMVLIKADSAANYKNVVDIMDEMLINNVPRYAIVNITAQEKEFLQ